MKQRATILSLALAFSVVGAGCASQTETKEPDLTHESTLVVLGTVTKVKDVMSTNDDGKEVLHQQVVTVTIESVLKGDRHADTFVIISPVEKMNGRRYTRGETGTWYIAGFEKSNLASLVDVQSGFVKKKE